MNYIKYILSCLILGAAISAPAETHTVKVTSFSFTPKKLTIQRGDTVRWVWKANGHSVVSGKSGVPDQHFTTETTLSQGSKFSVKFTRKFLQDHPVKSNLYNYFCDQHFGFGMVGSVRVAKPSSAKNRKS